MMILDTNVLSALMQQPPEPQVVAWLDRQSAESIWITSVTLFEARYGLELLPAGHRKTTLQERFGSLLQDDLENRVLVFDANAANELPHWPLRAKQSAARWTCATPLLPVLPRRGAPRWRHATCGILMI